MGRNRIFGTCLTIALVAYGLGLATDAGVFDPYVCRVPSLPASTQGQPVSEPTNQPASQPFDLPESQPEDLPSDDVPDTSPSPDFAEDLIPEDTPVNPPLLTSDLPEHDLAYAGLTTGRQADYDAMLNAVASGQPSVRLKTTDPNEADRAYMALVADHPEFFWLEGYSYKVDSTGLDLYFTRTLSDEEIRDLQADIDWQTECILSGMPMYATTYDKVKYFYDWIVDNTDYDLDAPNNQTILSVLLGGRSVCAGYSRTFEYLCHLEGIPCSYVWGDTPGGSHAWNIVDIDGTTTWVDVTYGDPIYSEEQDPYPFEAKNYDYFCITTDEMSRNHSLSSAVPPMPQCDSMRYDYARLQGTLIDTYNDGMLESLVAVAEQAGESAMMCKVSSREDFDRAMAYVKGDGLLQGPLAGYTTCWYRYNETLYTIELSWI